MDTTLPKLGSVEETNRLLGGQYFDPTTLAPIRPFVPAAGLGTSVGTDILGTQPLTLPSAVPSVNPGVAIIASAEKAQEDLQKQAEANIKAEEKAVGTGEGDSLTKRTLDSIKKAFGVQGDIYDEAAKAQDVITPEIKALNELNTQAADYTTQYRAEKDAIKARGDITQAAQQGLQANLDDKYGRILADIAIRQSAAQGNITALQAAADRKLNLKLGKINSEIDYLSKFELENAESLTKKEKEQLTALRAEKERMRKEVVDAENVANDVLKTAITNGVKVPDAIVQQINANPSQAYQILAANGISLQDPLDRAYKQAQISKIVAETTPGGGVVIKKVDANGNPLPVGAEEQALSVILGSGKFTAAQAKAVTNAINNGEDPFTVVKNQAKALLTGANQTKIESAEAVQSSMNALKDSLNAFYAAGGSTGLVTGNFEKVTNKLGQVKDPGLAALAVEVQSQLQSYRNAISGTAYSDQEGRDIASVFPGINKSKTLNDAIFVGRDKSLQSQIDGAYRSVLGSSYDALRKAETKSNVPKTEEEVTNSFQSYLDSIRR